MALDRLRELLRAFSTGGPNDFAAAAIEPGENRGLAGILSNFAGSRARAGIAQEQDRRKREVEEADIGYKKALTGATEQLGLQRGASARLQGVKADLAPIETGLREAKTTAEVDRLVGDLDVQRATITEKNARAKQLLQQAISSGRLDEARDYQNELRDSELELREIEFLHKQSIDLREQTRKEDVSTLGTIPSLQAGAERSRAAAGEAVSRRDINVKRLESGIPLEFQQQEADIGLTKARTATELKRPDLVTAQTTRAGTPKTMTLVQRLKAVRDILSDKVMTMEQKRAALRAVDSKQVGVDPAKQMTWTEKALQKFGKSPTTQPVAVPSDLPTEPGDYTDPATGETWRRNPDGSATKVK